MNCELKTRTSRINKQSPKITFTDMFKNQIDDEINGFNLSFGPIDDNPQNKYSEIENTHTKQNVSNSDDNVVGDNHNDYRSKQENKNKNNPIHNVKEVFKLEEFNVSDRGATLF